jgi:hypothetical protein
MCDILAKSEEWVAVSLARIGYQYCGQKS